MTAGTRPLVAAATSIALLVAAATTPNTGQYVVLALAVQAMWMVASVGTISVQLAGLNLPRVVLRLVAGIFAPLVLPAVPQVAAVSRRLRAPPDTPGPNARLVYTVAPINGPNDRRHADPGLRTAARVTR